MFRWSTHKDTKKAPGKGKRPEDSRAPLPDSRYGSFGPSSFASGPAHAPLPAPATPQNLSVMENDDTLVTLDDLNPTEEKPLLQSDEEYDDRMQSRSSSQSVMENDDTLMTLEDYAMISPINIRPLLWSDEKYAEFLRIYGDRTLSRRSAEFRVSQLMQQYRELEPVPREVSKGYNMGAFRSEISQYKTLSSQMEEERLAKMEEERRAKQVVDPLEEKYPSVLPHDNVIKEIAGIPTMQLGFSSQAVFIREGDGYRVLMAEKGGTVDESLEGKVVSRAFTNSVSSCMFVALSDREETFCIVMHLNEKTRPNVAQIQAALERAGIQNVRADNMFVSRVDEEKAKEEAIAHAFDMDVPSPKKRRVTLNRGPVEEYKMMQHSEIGVDFRSGKPVVVGTQGPANKEFLMDTFRGLLVDCKTYKDFFDRMMGTLPPAICDMLQQDITREEFDLMINPGFFKNKEKSIEEFLREFDYSLYLPVFAEYFFHMPLNQETQRPHSGSSSPSH